MQAPAPANDGERRCYWALLDAQELRFRYLDHSFQSSLREQAPNLLMTSLYDWLKPEDLQKAKDDFGSFINSKTLFGAVNRASMARVHVMRKKLGAIDADEGVDEPNVQYRQLKVVSSFVGDNTILCFFHQLADRDTEADSNEDTLSQWSNWCGYLINDTEDSPLSTIEAAKINAVMAACEAEYQRESSQTHGLSQQEGPRYIFQVYAKATADLLVEHPPSASSHPYDDDDKVDYARLAKEVWERPAENTAGAKTSCTRRYKSTHPILTDKDTRYIQSVIIRYQSICFACFQTRDFKEDPKHIDPNTSPTPQTTAAFPNSYNRNSLSTDPSTLGKRRRSHTENDGSASKPVPIPLPLDPAVTGPVRPWNFVTDAGERFEDAVSPTVASGAAILGSFQNLRPFGGFGLSPLANTGHSAEAILSGLSADAAQQHHPLSMPAYLNYSHGSNNGVADFSPVPMPAQLPVHAHAHAHVYATHPPTQMSRSYSNGSADSGYVQMPVSLSSSAGGNGRNDSGSGQPRACSSCGTTNSPEWRKGPNGVKSLCNACGLRFARSQARKNKQAAKEQAEREGKPLPAAPPKKKKQKKLASKDASPEHSTVYDYESPSNPQSDQQQHHQEHMHHSMHGNDHHQGVPLHHGSMSTTLPPIHSLIMPPTSTGHHFYPFHNFGSDPLDHRLGVNNQHW